MNTFGRLVYVTKYYLYCLDTLFVSSIIHTIVHNYKYYNPSSSTSGRGTLARDPGGEMEPEVHVKLDVPEVHPPISTSQRLTPEGDGVLDGEREVEGL